MEIKYRGFEIVPNDFADGYANTPSDYKYLAHKGDGDPVYHWGPTIEAVKESIDAEYEVNEERIAIQEETLDPVADMRQLAFVTLAHERGEDCGGERCQKCCPHDDRDHGICLDCGEEEDPGAAIDRAMDYGEDR